MCVRVCVCKGRRGDRERKRWRDILVDSVNRGSSISLLLLFLRRQRRNEARPISHHWKKYNMCTLTGKIASVKLL